MKDKKPPNKTEPIACTKCKTECVEGDLAGWLFGTFGTLPVGTHYHGYVCPNCRSEEFQSGMAGCPNCALEFWY